MNLKPLAPEYAKKCTHFCTDCPRKPDGRDIRDGCCEEQDCERIPGWIVRGMRYWKHERNEEMRR